MNRHRNLWRSVSLALMLAIAATTGVTMTAAQDEAATASMQTAATGLTNPRGMTWDDEGTMYVALAGSGAVAQGDAESDAPSSTDTGQGNLTSAVATIEAGCPVAVATGIPSAVDGSGGVIGAVDVAFLDGQLYVLNAAGGASLGHPDSAPGLYLVNDDGTTTLVADHAAWLIENPPSTPPPGGFPNPGELYAMVADEDRVWVVDSNNGLISTITPAGVETLVADLSADHPVPTGIALSPDGGVYVANLSRAPFPDGGASVRHIAEDGTITEVWTELTMVTDIAVGPDGTLYAVEMSVGNTEEEPYVVPGTGRLVRQTGPDSSETVVDGLLFPVSLATGPDEALYVAMPAVGADRGTGEILRVDLTGEGISTTAGAPFCDPIPETVPDEPIPFATPAG